MLRQRVITAVVLVIGVLAALFGLSPRGFSILAAMVTAYALWEWSFLAGLGQPMQRIAFVVAALGGSMGLAVLGLDFAADALLQAPVRTLLAVSCAWWLVALALVGNFPRAAAVWGRRWRCLGMGVLVLVPFGVVLSLLVHHPQGAWLILLVVAIVACADIGAYFCGRRFGRRKLAPAVSPGKSWEGVLGGMGSVAALAIALGIYVDADAMGRVLWLGLALVTGVASVIGDLLESMVKRQRGVKDSGNILPGHGGLLDRIDGLTAALPVFALCYSLAHSRL